MSVVRIVLSRTATDDSDDSVLVITSYSITRISLLFPRPQRWCPRLSRYPRLPGARGFRCPKASDTQAKTAPARAQFQVVGSSSEDGWPATQQFPRPTVSKALKIRQFEGISLVCDIGKVCNQSAGGA